VREKMSVFSINTSLWPLNDCLCWPALVMLKMMAEDSPHAESLIPVQLRLEYFLDYVHAGI
jgi:hypothetical protein